MHKNRLDITIQPIFLLFFQLLNDLCKHFPVFYVHFRQFDERVSCKLALTVQCCFVDGLRIAVIVFKHFTGAMDKPSVVDFKGSANVFDGSFSRNFLSHLNEIYVASGKIYSFCEFFLSQPNGFS